MIGIEPDRGAAVSQFLPHEGDAVLLDAVWIDSPLATCGTATVRAGTPFHDEPSGWPAWVAIELMAQVIAAGAGLRDATPGRRPRLGLLLGARGFESREALYPLGNQLEIRVVESTRGIDGMAVYDCRIDTAGQQLAQAVLSVCLPEDIDEYLDSLEP